ncbi:class 1 fructose-bisphosphatase [Rufibacter glacialis]|uniref:Fructose-1,6-bisphosphatase class 1 n=1 Tax=Rufibacter glacialis TaxID=1259555 RepID=A0A5M8Q5N1_9BACT|nr:class 1 fructose-bisphosphatase [Rufibacter glacialis]KAA6430653.1 class 1 fructose-bisphosphatase [Rufibacter glacialis]GGK85461.1 fructose-1,6-bisphosphatase class 1 [Rufibacter glacialis]
MNDALALPVGTTLDRFIMRKQEQFPYATGELSQLLRDLALAAKIVSREITRADQDTMGSNGEQNVQGEEQQKLDLIANIRFIRALRNGGEVCTIVSEEDEDIIHTGNQNAKYIVAMDPLDGSSNISVNIPIGTIFSIYRRISEVGQNGTLEDCLQKGTQQAAAGYILYGASTMLVYTTGHGVNGFTYEPSLGEFFLSHPDIKIPANGNQYSCNDANVSNFPLGIQNYLAFCREQKYSSRYIGSLVADFHRNLLKGGIYFYPASAKNKTGKLRLLYECNPLAFIAEQAGGQATDGIHRILDKVPTELHERCPLVIGSSEMIEKVKKYMTL